MLLPGLVACTTGNGLVGADDAGSDGVVAPPEPPPLAIEAPAAFDPLRGPVTLALVTAPDVPVTLEVAGTAFEGTADDAGRFEVSWDGRHAGAFLPAALHPVHATATSDGLTTEADAAVATVRPGFLVARLEDDDGTSALRVPLLFPLSLALQEESDPVSVLDAIDDGSTPLDFPALPADEILAFRPEPAEPAAFRFDARPLLVLEAAEDSEALGSTGLDLVPIDVAAEGFTVLSGSPLAPGVPAVLQRDEPLGDTVGVSELEVILSFSAGGASLGEQRLPLTIYRVLDASQFEDPSPTYRPWAPVVDPALRGIEGTPADHDAVVDALVEWVYFDLGLEYDTQFGASHYSSYRQFDWDRPHFRLSDFLARTAGNVINCTDAANILGAYANMVGARLDHLVIDPSFDLNYIQAIGGSEFTRCPFGGFGCGFSYHAVTTSPGTFTVWDATLALDGDADPRELPGTVLLVQTISSEEYLDRLVRAGNPTYHSQAQETLE